MKMRLSFIFALSALFILACGNDARMRELEAKNQELAAKLESRQAAEAPQPAEQPAVTSTRPSGSSYDQQYAERLAEQNKLLAEWRNSPLDLSNCPAIAGVSCSDVRAAVIEAHPNLVEITAWMNYERDYPALYDTNRAITVVFDESLSENERNARGQMLLFAEWLVLEKRGEHAYLMQLERHFPIGYGGWSDWIEPNVKRACCGGYLSKQEKQTFFEQAEQRLKLAYRDDSDLPGLIKRLSCDEKACE